MMTYDEALLLLSARVDGELSPEQEKDLNSWLNEHPDGRIIAEAFQTQDAEMRRAFEPRRAAAAATAARVVAQLPMPNPIDSRQPPRRRRGRVWAFLPAFGALAVLAFVVFHLLRPANPEPTVQHDTVKRVPFGPYDLLTPRPKPAAPQSIVAQLGAHLDTKAGEKRRVVLTDGSILYLNQNTSVEVAAERFIKLLRGQVFIEASPADKTAGRGAFQVETPQRKLTALGTRFAVNALAKATSLLVTQGMVKIDGEADPIVAGQVIEVDAEKRSAPRPARRASYELDWTRELMIAADSPLVPSGKYDGGALIAVDPYGQEAKLSMVKYHIDVHIEDGFARTTIDQTYFNHENFQMEGTFYFPLPPDASLSRLAMYVANGEMCSLMEGGMAERDFARQTYERIRHANRDPALLEWVDGSLFKMRVFPLEARQEKRLLLSYTQKLPVQYGRTAYRFPAGHSLSVVKKWSFEAVVKGGAGLAAGSPSHPGMKVERVGDDLVLRDRAEAIKVDRDVVLEFSEPATQAASVRWSSAEHERAKYLMVRFRPDLPGAPRRERRDWVFLFEASGARDPLVARAQVEIVRALLKNADHDDTFALLTFGTHVRKFNPEALPVTDDNVKNALDFLDKTHLIGALNLEQALSAAAPWLTSSSNPHLVHLGGGITTLGEHRPDKLIPIIPGGTRYVGVAVGKRFSTAFMKTAAEKTGGLFTQINPDEPIAWRGFELASALNTPRLLDITLSTPAKAGEEPVRFLPFTNAISQGEELAAVARIDGDTPQAVTIRGTRDGVSYETTIEVKDVVPNAGYLPRTWAKLEIDRLLAEDASAHRQRITEMSKAMYVMTPFTSLLVLENDAMYKEFKVDRGRKDHWAMYPCPDKVPTVYVPDPNRPTDRNAIDFQLRKPHANAVLQTIMMRSPPRYLAWPGQNGVDPEVYTAGQSLARNKDQANKKNMTDLPVIEEMARLDDNKIVGGASTRFSVFGKKQRDVARLIGLNTYAGPTQIDELRRTDLRDSHLFRKSKEEFNYRIGYDAAELTNPDMGLDADLAAAVDVERESDFVVEALAIENETVGLPNHKRDFALQTANLGSLSLSQAERRIDGLGVELDGRLSLSGDLYFRGRSGATRQHLWGFGGGIQPAPTDQPPSALWTMGFRSVVDGDQPMPTNQPFADKESKTILAFVDLAPIRRIQAVLSDAPNGPRYYGRPSFNNQNRVFTDLLSYAPGMSSSAADIRAVLEAEAAPHAGLRRGTIDPGARQRIDAARRGGWRQIAFKDALDNDRHFHFDGQGRYAYEARIAFGLVERVVCDGNTIWHLYPELGIGAQRNNSRFHRAELAKMIPDVLPPADDLNYGFDVKLIDADTIALIPVREVGAEESAKPRTWIETQLIFEGDRLARRQWIAMPAKTEIGRQSFAADGSIRLVDEKGKELNSEVRSIAPSSAPQLNPDLSALVILQLPLRSREFVYRKLDLDPNRNLFDGSNCCFEYLAPDAALELLASEVAHNNSGQVEQIWNSCFAKRGDRRHGFFTLLLSSGNLPIESEFHAQLMKAVRDNELSPLVRYLSLAFEPNANYWQTKLGLLPGPEPTHGFLSDLLTFRALTLRWQGNGALDFWEDYRSNEKERAIAFARQNAANAWGWSTLAMVADRACGAEFHQQIAAAWKLLGFKSGLDYIAGYEQAVNLLNAEKPSEARQLFRKLFQQTFKEGMLPPIDRRFRDAFVDDTDGHEWRNLMVGAAKECIAASHRPIAVQLAWQCRQLGDQAVADELLALALHDSPSERDRARAAFAAIEYLWAVNDIDQADALVQQMLTDTELRQPPVWRLAACIAERRGDRIRQFEYLEKALDGEFARMPAVFSLEPVRRDYAALLGHYEWLADASRNLHVAPPADLLVRTLRAADRWRSLDVEAPTACNQAAKILRLIGSAEAEALAWDFLTTPLALRPNESEPWLGLAHSAIAEGNLATAEECYQAAFAAEPTNAQILWDWAKLRERSGEIAGSRSLLSQLANGDWQPRFAALKTQAKQAVTGR